MSSGDFIGITFYSSEYNAFDSHPYSHDGPKLVGALSFLSLRLPTMPDTQPQALPTTHKAVRLHPADLTIHVEEIQAPE